MKTINPISVLFCITVCRRVTFASESTKSAAVIFVTAIPQDVKVRFAMTRLFTNENIKPACPSDEQMTSLWDSNGNALDVDTTTSLPVSVKSSISKKESI